MFTRIFNYLIKLKVLNILLLMFMVFSFVLVSISSYYIVKDFKLNNKFGDMVGAVTYSDYKITDSNEKQENFVSINISDLKSIDQSAKSVNGLKNINYNINTDLVEENTSNFMAETGAISSIMISDKENIKNEGEIVTGEFSDDGVVVSENIAKEMSWKVGDTINIGKRKANFNDSGYIEATGISKSVSHKITGIINYGENTDSMEENVVFGIIYMPVNELLKHDDETTINGQVTLIFDTPENAKTYYDEVSAKDNKMYVSLLEDEFNEMMSVYFKISDFFRVIWLVTVILFIISFAVLNNNVFAKRRNELQLYNVFGLKMSMIYLQTFIEKLILFAISLIFGVVISIFAIKNANTIVSSVIEYSIDTNSFSNNIPTEVMEKIDFALFENGYNVIKVNSSLIIIGAVTLFIILIGIINTIQVRLQKDIIFNQRRGE